MAHYLISEASRKLNVEAHVLRYWEEELKLEIPRNELGHRYYTEKQLALFQKIKELKELGYQLKAIRTSLNQDEEAELKAGEAGFLLEKDREMAAVEPRFKVLEGELAQAGDSQAPETMESDSLQRETAEPDQLQKGRTEHSRLQKSEAVHGQVPKGKTEPNQVPKGKTEPNQLPKAGQDESAGENEADSRALFVQETDRHRQLQSGLNAAPEKLEQFQNIMTDVLAEALRRNHTSFSSEVSGQISDKVVKEMNYLLRDKEEREEERYRKLDEAIRTAQRVQKQKNEAAATKVPERKTRKKRFSFGRKK